MVCRPSVGYSRRISCRHRNHCRSGFFNRSNRSIVKFGLEELNKTKRVGLVALIRDVDLTQGELGTYDVSHVLAPRLNAMGRLVHAMDALRLICTKQADKAAILATTLGLTNKERQQLTIDTTRHALEKTKTGSVPNCFLWHMIRRIPASSDWLPEN